MHTFALYALDFLAGFAGGWAFFKHRQAIKDAAAAESKKVLASIDRKIP